MTVPPTKKKQNKAKQKTMRKKNKAKKVNKIFLKCKWPTLPEEEKEMFKKNNCHHTYGYITPEGISHLLKGIRKKGKSFYDLGSGIGRPAISVATLFPQINEIVGIELSKSRYDISQGILETLPHIYKSKIKFMNKNFLDSFIDLSKADIIWTNSMCFPKECLEQLGVKINKEAKIGTYIYSSKKLNIPRAQDLGIKKVKQSWNDDSKVHCYKISINNI